MHYLDSSHKREVVLMHLFFYRCMHYHCDCFLSAVACMHYLTHYRCSKGHESFARGDSP